MNTRKLKMHQFPVTQSAVARANFRDAFSNRKSSGEDFLEKLLLQTSTNARKHQTNAKNLLDLPRNLRVEIWKRVHYKHFRPLRLVCRIITEDINSHLGISALVDEREREFDDHFESLGIRHATIINLNSPRVIAELKHPKLLVELTIRGPMSSAWFNYFIIRCENISSLTINFSKTILKTKPIFFPQPVRRCLPSIRTIKVISHTKKERDLIYVCDNLTSFFQDTLLYPRKIVELHFTLSHKTPSPYLDEIVLAVIMLAHRNFKTLQEFVLNVRETSSGGGGGGEDESEDGGQNRRGTAMVGSEKKSSISEHSPSQIQNLSNASSSLDQIMQFKMDKKNSQAMEATEEYLNLNRDKWPPFVNLTKVVVVVNSSMFDNVQEMLGKAKTLKHLKLELTGGVIINCWLTYERIVESASRTLTSIKLFSVSYQDYLKNPIDIDFSIFRSCNSLKQLHISCLKRETKRLPGARNVTTLPKNILELEIFFLALSTWQWFRLLRRYKQLDTISVAYVTKSDRSFGWFLNILRWLISFKMTKVQSIFITDLKIRFRNKRSNIKKLMNSVPVKIEYVDQNETTLEVDMGKARKSEHSIPSIYSE